MCLQVKRAALSMCGRLSRCWARSALTTVSTAWRTQPWLSTWPHTAYPSHSAPSATTSYRCATHTGCQIVAITVCTVVSWLCSKYWILCNSADAASVTASPRAVTKSAGSVLVAPCWPQLPAPARCSGDDGTVLLLVTCCCRWHCCTGVRLGAPG
jgi:hypothetical protein